jgi:hypothetical protein
VELRAARKRQPSEFAEAYTQEWEAECDEDVAREFRARLVERSWLEHPVRHGYAGYQLIRNVLAAQAIGGSFCVLHDARRPDLRDAWYAVLTAVCPAMLRTRLKVFTWQELAEALPSPLRVFLRLKYGIEVPGEEGEHFPRR